MDLATHISSSTCSRCGGPAPDWKCPKCDASSKAFDPSHWRDCQFGAKMQAKCQKCSQAESDCTCVHADTQESKHVG